MVLQKISPSALVDVSVDRAADGIGWYVARRSAAMNTVPFCRSTTTHVHLCQILASYDAYAIPSAASQHFAFLEYINTNNVSIVENF